MLETALVAFTTFFATIGPLDTAALFPALTPQNTARERRAMALKGCLIGAGILVFFALFGEGVLRAFGITLPALRTAGGVLLLLIAIDMVFARNSGGTTTTADERAEAQAEAGHVGVPAGDAADRRARRDRRRDPAGRRRAARSRAGSPSWSAALLAVVLLTFLLLLAATQVQKLLGVTGLQVITRVMGVLLAALAVQFLFDGIAASG